VRQRLTIKSTTMAEKTIEVNRKSLTTHYILSLEVTTKLILMELSTTKDVSTSISVEEYISQAFLLMFNPITIAVTEIKCLDETSELSASDEPYVLVVAADLQPLVPNVEATLYGIWVDVDAGETHNTLSLPPNIEPNLEVDCRYKLCTCYPNRSPQL